MAPHDVALDVNVSMALVFRAKVSLLNGILGEFSTLLKKYEPDAFLVYKKVSGSQLRIVEDFEGG